MAQQDPFGAAPSMPVAPQYVASPEAAAAPVERPASITRAVQLMYVGAALSLAGLAVTWATKNQLHDKVASAKAGTTLTPTQVDAAVNAGLIFGTVAALIGVGLWIWMAAANRAGRSWARIVATVLGGLNLVLTLIGLGQSSGLSIVLLLLTVVLAVVILVLLWRPASSAYYQAKSARLA